MDLKNEKLVRKWSKKKVIKREGSLAESQAPTAANTPDVENFSTSGKEEREACYFLDIGPLISPLTDVQAGHPALWIETTSTPLSLASVSCVKLTGWKNDWTSGKSGTARSPTDPSRHSPPVISGIMHFIKKKKKVPQRGS